MTFFNHFLLKLICGDFNEEWTENELDVVFGYFDFERTDFQEEVNQVKWVTKD